MKSKFLVHVVTNIQESKFKIKDLREKGFVIIGIEIPDALGLSLDYNITHTFSSDKTIEYAACINALSFKKMSLLNAIIMSKLDLDTLMSTAILRKISQKNPFYDGELTKIDLVARQDIGSIPIKEKTILAQLFSKLGEVRFYEKWVVVYNWLVGTLKLDGQNMSYKNTRQLIVEKFGKDILVVISFGLGAFSYAFLKQHKFVIAVNLNYKFMNNSGIRGRRYCISSLNENLTSIEEKLNKINHGWGGHKNIICSCPQGPSKLELSDIVKVLKGKEINEISM